MSAIKLNSSGGGSITISPASTASTLTLTAPAQTGTIGLDGPAFRAYINATTQTVSQNAWVKVALTGESFDTNNCFDSTTNYRFTPTLSGIYQVNGTVCCNAGASLVTCAIYKNGSQYSSGTDVRISSNVVTSTVVDLVYLNGSTDYIELYGYLS